jgi:hypothetical protein
MVVVLISDCSCDVLMVQERLIVVRGNAITEGKKTSV